MAAPQPAGMFREIERRLDENGEDHDKLWHEIEAAKRIAREEAAAVRKEHKVEHDRLWSAIDALKNRLPLWATLLISSLVALVSVALSFAGTIVVRMIFK